MVLRMAKTRRWRAVLVTDGYANEPGTIKLRGPGRRWLFVFGCRAGIFLDPGLARCWERGVLNEMQICKIIRDQDTRLKKLAWELQHWRVWLLKTIRVVGGPAEAKFSRYAAFGFLNFCLIDVFGPDFCFGDSTLGFFCCLACSEFWRNLAFRYLTFGDLCFR